MPAKSCPHCGSSELLTDYSAGNIVCQECWSIVEEGILVNEVGFSEGAGGRVHVQGTFVSNYSTGIAGFRGRGGQQQNTENIKAQGQARIEQIGEQMGLSHAIRTSAQRFFSLAVDNKFNRGRRTEYIIASCLYLSGRMKGANSMLIDFSERLSVNVFELGATYLKLRSTLHLIDPMPEIDPAIYNLRFANHLDFGHQVNSIAADASRLVRRFKADWMTQGRRPAGVCGACLIIAARMSNFLRTPEEVAQVVKVSPVTIRRRLVEFARTKMAGRTIGEWRRMNDEEITMDVGAEPPSVTNRRRADERFARAQALKRGITEEEEEDEEGSEEDGEDDDGRPRKKRKGDVDPDRDFDGAVRAAAEEYGVNANEEHEEENDDDDRQMDALDQAEYVGDLTGARDNPAEVLKQNKRDAKALKREMKAAMQPDAVDEVDLEDLEGLAEEELEEDDGNEKGDDDELEDGEGKDNEEGEGELREVEEGQRRRKPKKEFTDWNDQEATLAYLEQTHFQDYQKLFELSPAHLRERTMAWLKDRDPKVVAAELDAVERALKARERAAKTPAEKEFDDLDDAELENVYVMDDAEKKIRARMWLSSNGKWLEEEKERQEKRAAYAQANGTDPTKPKQKRPRPKQRNGPFPTAAAAIQNFTNKQNFSSRVNYNVMRQLGLDPSGSAKAEQDLQTFPDDKDDDDDKEDDEEDEKDDEEGHFDPLRDLRVGF